MATQLYIHLLGEQTTTQQRPAHSWPMTTATTLAKDAVGVAPVVLVVVVPAAAGAAGQATSARQSLPLYKGVWG